MEAGEGRLLDMLGDGDLVAEMHTEETLHKLVFMVATRLQTHKVMAHLHRHEESSADEGEKLESFVTAGVALRERG